MDSSGCCMTRLPPEQEYAINDNLSEVFRLKPRHPLRRKQFKTRPAARRPGALRLRRNPSPDSIPSAVQHKQQRQNQLSEYSHKISVCG